MILKSNVLFVHHASEKKSKHGISQRKYYAVNSMKLSVEQVTRGIQTPIEKTVRKKEIRIVASKQPGGIKTCKISDLKIKSTPYNKDVQRAMRKFLRKKSNSG
ncbi:hypothetical protein JTB14_029467 [Gonioctena quinquepunctata]|nr:hypothetical protein JTB14_029467 [Gonioctena quinquepunctata]